MRNFIQKRLQHRCFPVNLAKILRTPVLKNICERLVLDTSWVILCINLSQMYSLHSFQQWHFQRKYDFSFRIAKRLSFFFFFFYVNVKAFWFHLFLIQHIDVIVFVTKLLLSGLWKRSSPTNTIMHNFFMEYGIIHFMEYGYAEFSEKLTFLAPWYAHTSDKKY